MHSCTVVVRVARWNGDAGSACLHLVCAMTRRYANRLNPGVLWAAAITLFPARP